MSNSTNKIGRPPKSKHQKRTRKIEITLNDIEWQKYESLKLSLSSSSPPLSVPSFFRLVLMNIDKDDGAIFKWLEVDLLNPLIQTLFKTKKDYNKKSNKR